MRATPSTPTGPDTVVGYYASDAHLQAAPCIDDPSRGEQFGIWGDKTKDDLFYKKQPRKATALSQWPSGCRELEPRTPRQGNLVPLNRECSGRRPLVPHDSELPLSVLRYDHRVGVGVDAGLEARQADGRRAGANIMSDHSDFFRRICDTDTSDHRKGGQSAYNKISEHESSSHT